MSLLDLSRRQFAITVMFHMTFPAITVGLSILLCVVYGMYWRTGAAVYLQMFRFWRRIFAVGFRRLSAGPLRATHHAGHDRHSADRRHHLDRRRATPS